MVGLTVALTSVLAFGLTGVLTFGLMSVLAVGHPVVFVVGLAFGLTFGLTYGLYFYTGAGRRYLVFLCCARSRHLLPLGLGAFLGWANTGGLLRTSGIAYQLRHRELQDWLTRNPTP